MTRTKEQRYNAAGRVMAETANSIGAGPIDLGLWANIMEKAASLDDVFESDPSSFNDHALLLKRTGFNPDDEVLRYHLAATLDASSRAESAPTIREHFDLRSQEADHFMALLRYSDHETGDKNPEIWEQLSRVAVAGNLLDSVMDAKEDALRMPQFTPRELAFGGMRAFLEARKGVERSTWFALMRAGIKHDPARQFSKPAIALSSLTRVTFRPSVSHPAQPTNKLARG